MERSGRRLATSDTVAHRIRRVLGPIAPPGTARRRLLRRGYRILKSLAKLRNRRYVSRQIATLWDRAILSVAIRICRDPLARERLRDEAPCRWREILASLAFPVRDHVDVSIVIAVHNHFWRTLQCLHAIQSATDGPAYEVIVVDDCSTDRTPRILNKVAGVVTLRNERKGGFIASRNRGAVKARGEHLVFLEQDVLVTPGWLGALVRTFQESPGTGLAGAKAVDSGGRLLEAGAVLWRDGSAWAYGKLDQVDHPRYNFAREVDYCSAGCVMIRRALFLELGGFDSESQTDAYDHADLAFRIRHSGHQVIYQPLAKIVERDGGPAQAHTPQEIRSRTRNQRRFRERWRERLDFHPESNSGLSRLVRAHGLEAGSLGQVLVIDHRIPTPDRDCGSLRMAEIMRRIRQAGHHVALVPDKMLVLTPYLQDLQSQGIEVALPPHYHSVLEYLEQHGRDFDLAIISRADVADRHMATVKRLAPRAKIVFDTVDLHFLREERQAAFRQDPATRAAVALRKEQELRLARSADLTLVVSPTEKAVLEQESGGQVDVRILPTIYPACATDPPGWNKRRDIVFIGSFAHLPNIDAVLYFAREIFPRVRARIPAVVFKVIGPEPTPEIEELRCPSIHILGFVSDVKPVFDRARVAVAPIRFGAGVKGKVNQSMSFGVPTVVTSIAAEGMYLTDGENALIADDAQSFADAVVRLWTHSELWRKVSRSGIQSLNEHFSVEAAARPIDELLVWAGLSAAHAKKRGSRNEREKPSSFRGTSGPRGTWNDLPS